MNQQIEGKEYVKPATAMVVRRMVIELGDGAIPYGRCSVELYDNEGNVIRNEQVEFTKEELDPWADDDTVLIPLVAEKLGLTIK